MRCGDVMNEGNLECCFPWESASVAAARMRFRNLGFLPVLNGSGRLIGVITDRDLALRVLADARSPTATRVGEVISRPPIICHPWEDLASAEERMVRHRVRRLVVVDEDSRLLGVISLSDIAAHDAPWRTGQLLRGIAPREIARH